jgi:hypothetical protein
MIEFFQSKWKQKEKERGYSNYENALLKSQGEINVTAINHGPKQSIGGGIAPHLVNRNFFLESFRSPLSTVTS